MVDKWKVIGQIKASKYRSKVLVALAKGQLTPTEIAEATGIRGSHVSRALRELSKMGLVECLSPDLRKGRLYTVTDLGKDVYSALARKR